MKIIQPKNTKKTLLIAFPVILLVIILLAISAYYKVGPFAPKINNAINFDKPTSEQVDTGSQTKQQTIDQSNNKDNTGSDPTPAPQPVEGSDKKTVNMEITAINQTNTALQIRTLIQTITSEGTCSLSMNGPSGKTYTSTATIQALPSSSTCKGFDVPLTELSQGVWMITVSFTNDNLATSATREITIK